VKVVDTIIDALFECVDYLLWVYFLIFVKNDIKIRFRLENIIVLIT
jgi:hypothetical protein